MNLKFRTIFKFLRRHSLFIIFICVGIVAGPFGFVAGFFAGAFSEVILHRIGEEKKIRKIVGEARTGENILEPFPGALQVCTLAVLCAGDDYSAARQMELVFKKKYDADWISLCSAISGVEINEDLAVEMLAANLLKASKKGNDYVPVAEIFLLLKNVEFNWNEKRGEKPSVYLATLLNYSVKNDELESAYMILGLSADSSLSEVKKAHRALAAKFHPDSGTQKNSAEFIRVQKAYELIIEKNGQ